jgi:hypothetical protein
VARATGLALERAREQARSAALAELGQQVQVEVRSRISTELEKVTLEGRTRTSESFRAVNEVLSRLQLRGAAPAAEWADARECRLWVRLRIPLEEAERARRAATAEAAAAGIQERLAQARDGARAAAQRQAALAEAGELSKLVDSALVPGFSRDGFELQRAELEGTLGAARQREDQYRAAMLRHVQAYARAGAAAPGAERRGAQVGALRELESAAALAPAGVPGYELPFNPLERLATLYAELNAACSGARWFEQRQLALPPALRPAGAGPAACDAAATARERRALALAGRTVRLECQLTLAGSKADWPRACTALQNSFVGDGAVPLAAGTARAELTVSIAANGQIEERKDADSGRTGWRFRGQVQTRLAGAGGVDLAERYEGLTGWNPVSASMAGDLLALAVVKRLEAALDAYWSK